MDKPRATILTKVAVVVGISNLGGAEGAGHQGPLDSPVEGVPRMSGPPREGV